MAQRCAHLKIYGRVQGVWFRGWTAQQAVKSGVRGWVRNRRDGSVEAMFSGDEGAVTQLIEKCHQGPPVARVEKIDVTDTTDPGFDGFEKRPTE